MKRLMIASTALALALPAFAQVEDACVELNESRDTGEEVNCDLEDTGISLEAAEEFEDIEDSETGISSLTAEEIIDDDRGIVNEEAEEQFEEIEEAEDESL